MAVFSFPAVPRASHITLPRIVSWPNWPGIGTTFDGKVHEKGYNTLLGVEKWLKRKKKTPNDSNPCHSPSHRYSPSNFNGNREQTHDQIGDGQVEDQFVHTGRFSVSAFEQRKKHHQIPQQTEEQQHRVDGDA